MRPNFKIWIILKFPFYSRKGRSVGLIGCGHHAFSTIAYYLATSTDSKLSFLVPHWFKLFDSMAPDRSIDALHRFGVSDEFNDVIITI